MLMLQQSLLLLLLIHSQELHELKLSSQDSMRAMSFNLQFRKCIKLLISLCAFSTWANYPHSLRLPHRHGLVLEHLKCFANYIPCFAYTRTCWLSVIHVPYLPYFYSGWCGCLLPLAALVYPQHSALELSLTYTLALSISFGWAWAWALALACALALDCAVAFGG